MLLENCNDHQAQEFKPRSLRQGAGLLFKNRSAASEWGESVNRELYPAEGPLSGMENMAKENMAQSLNSQSFRHALRRAAAPLPTHATTIPMPTEHPRNFKNTGPKSKCCPHKPPLPNPIPPSPVDEITEKMQSRCFTSPSLSRPTARLHVLLEEVSMKL